MPALFSRSMAPIHSSKSGFTGFFTSTGISTPFKASAISCMAKGLAEVRAPIQRRSIPAFRAASTCLELATSVVTYIPVSAFTRFIHSRPGSPTPSKPPGLVRGFHIPALNIFMPFLANAVAVVITCSSVSALQGPAITSGRSSLTPCSLMGCKSNSIILYFNVFILSNASFRRSSLQQSEMRIKRFPLLPKMKPGVMNTLASCSTRSVSSSTSA